MIYKGSELNIINIPVAVRSFYRQKLKPEEFLSVEDAIMDLSMLGFCDIEFKNPIQEKYFLILLELHEISTEKIKNRKENGAKGGLKAKENRLKKNKIRAEDGKTEKLNKKLIDIKTKKPVKGKPFIPPTLAEVEEFCRQRKNNVDAKTFYDYYEVGNWKDSKGNSVKNWKQKLISVWERGDTDKNPKEETKNRTQEEQKAYLEDLLNW